MPRLNDGIVSWDEGVQPYVDQLSERAGITTEAEPKEDPRWGESIDALLIAWSESAPLQREGDERPCRVAIGEALSWAAFLRKRHPQAPPTCIVPEPSGGIIMERRSRAPSGHDYLCELTFYNNGSSEITEYFDGRVQQIDSLPKLARHLPL